MAEIISGKKLIYLFRKHDDAATVDGYTMAFTTENGRTKSKDADSTATKDGDVRTPGTVEHELTVTSLYKKGDTKLASHEQALDDSALFDIWEANLEDPQEYTYALTTDTAIVAGKTYYTRSGTSPNYTYTAVETPSASSLSSYYERTATKFAGRYMQGYLTELEQTSNAEDFVEISQTFGINGTGVTGNVTVSVSDQNAAAYAFADTPKTGA